jgi:uncharacterized coiled-coil DUF342 family protein
MDYNEDPDPFCTHCDGWRKKAEWLAVQLAVVEKERDAGNAAVKHLAELVRAAAEDYTAANARVKELEAALDPTVDVRREYVAELMANTEFDETADAIMAMDGLLHAIRARAGLTKEGK